MAQAYEYVIDGWDVVWERGRVTGGWQDVIHRRAADGWRLVQVVTPELPAVPSRFELVFERPTTPEGD